MIVQRENIINQQVRAVVRQLALKVHIVRKKLVIRFVAQQVNFQIQEQVL